MNVRQKKIMTEDNLVLSKIFMSLLDRHFSLYDLLVTYLVFFFYKHFQKQKQKKFGNKCCKIKSTTDKYANFFHFCQESLLKKL